MTLAESLKDDIKTAMKARDKDRLSVLRLIKTDLDKAELDQGKPLDPDGEQKVLARMAKQRRDSIEQFEAGGRTELAEKEKVELSIIETFLPKKLEESEVDRIIDETLASLEPDQLSNRGMVMGKVMGALKKTGKSFDGKDVNQRVNQRLNQ